MINSFLMASQSNMAGRGYLTDVEQIYDEKIKMLVNGCWQTMTEPINFDRPTSGIGLAASFAGAWRLEYPTVVECQECILSHKCDEICFILLRILSLMA